jgi:N-sulfoglucosamine sulfohydrolase
MITRRSVLKAAAPAVMTRAGQSKPNILLVTADDLGPLLSCYGERRIRTPHLDKLAGSGVRFRTAYVTQASCSPSRSGMFTGVYPHGNGQYGLVNGDFALHEPMRKATIPAVLKTAGYRTGIIGKLHVAPEESFPFDMRETNNAVTRRVREVSGIAGDFVSKQPGDPFFLMVNFSDPHAFRAPDHPHGWDFPPQVDGIPVKPYAPGPTSVFPFQQIDNPEQRIRVAGYFNAIQRLDEGIGMLMDTLGKSGREQDTVVLFVGDHGPPFARGKTTVYESGLRVPYMVRWPGVSKPGVSSALVSTVDLAPTIFDAAGVSSPVKVHGRSLRTVLGGGSAKWREYLAAEFHFHGARPFYPRRAIRDQRYKLIHNLLAGRGKPSTGIDGDQAYPMSRQAQYEGTAQRRAFDTFADPPEFELYDLRSDPVEFVNLAARSEARGVLERMKGAMVEWRKETEDPLLDAGKLEEMSKRAG